MLEGAIPLRKAAAEARHTLVGMAAARFGLPSSRLQVTDGVVSDTSNPATKITYGELIGGKRFNVTMKVTSSVPNVEQGAEVNDLTGQATLKTPDQYKIIGKPIPRVDIPAKVTGSSTRIENLRLPGMVHGRVVLPPNMGAKLVSVDGFNRRPPGLIRVLARGNFVGIVAEQEWQAIQAAQTLKVTWSPGPGVPAAGSGDLYQALRRAPATGTAVRRNIGNVDAAYAGAVKTLTADYHYPMSLHGMLGPNCAIASYEGGRMTIWAGTQHPPQTRADVAAVAGIPRENVRVIWHESSGTYGRLGIDDAATGAALLSHAVGKPVRLQWSRQQEHTWSPMMPPHTYTLRAGLDASGKIVAYDGHGWTWSTTDIKNDLTSILLGIAPPPTTTFAGTYRVSGGGDVSNYSLANERLTSHGVANMYRGNYVRAPSRIQVNFAGESFMDELAAAIGADPVQFRLSHMTDPRGIRVVQEVAKAANWETRPSPARTASDASPVVKGRGMSFVSGQKTSYCAMVAECEVTRKTGKVRVTRLTVALDAGIVINPDAIRSQVEGASLYALSRAMHEEVTFTGEGKITSSDWSKFPILRFMEVPDIEISLINQRDLQPGGVGEIPNTLPPAAVGNAIFDATGVRVRQVPLTPPRSRAALAAGGK
jgi:CO/xanthine dehydrogenase Mo-binding subunit